ncbi:PRC-barrel domain containing protein [Natrialbaceae archaeon GCM10025810]|uniref:PRC-barrel domain containing protein n=1 Tax=Halovalidus salilacus TaxID=3075124 RepID=UPI00360A7A35
MTDDTITKADEGKRVLNADGTEAGRIVYVDADDARGYVDPDPGIAGTIRAKLGRGTITEEAHPLDEGSIAEITADTVHLRGTL